MIPIKESVVNFTGDLGIAGFSRASRQANLARARRITEAARLWADLKESGDFYLLTQALRPTSEVAFRHLCHNYPALFQETMTTSDFSALTVDVLDRMLFGAFQTAAMVSLPLCKQTTVNNFRDVKRYTTDGMTTNWDAVPENAGFNRKALTQNDPITFGVKKYEAGFQLSWESLVNDDLGIFDDLPTRITAGAVSTMEQFITGLYCDASGPHASLYTVGNANIINTSNGAASNNPRFSAAGIADGLRQLARRRNTDGTPIQLGGQVYLVYGPGLISDVKHLLNAISLRIAMPGETQSNTNKLIEVRNWLNADLVPIMNPWIPIVASSANAETSWFLFQSPAQQPRPVLEFARMRGFETPVLYRKAGNTARVGGGVDETMGDFETMSQEMKGIVVFGGSQISGVATVASNGSGS